jgi:general secretion pathway protein E
MLSVSVSLPAGLLQGTALATVVLPFSPTKLAFLIGWVYLCLYLVQYVQFSSLVSKKFKPHAKIITLLTGPIFLISIIVIDAAKKAAETRRTMFEVVKEQVKTLIATVKSSRILKSKGIDAKIKLFNTAGNDIKELYSQNKDAHPVIELVEQIIGNALEDRASDILIDPKDDSNYTIRYRVDGVLKVVYKLKADMCKAVINSIKALSDMDIAEKRRPQDGSFKAQTADITASFRVASAGVLGGEKLSIRVLNQNAGRFKLDNIGLSTKQQITIRQAIHKPSGMILMCGPTGSGKTTTLYAMLNEIDLYTRNVITVEDPIEYSLPNASQIEVNPKADITFAKSLRSILRQDPDVICVGEIRDNETAQIALQASQTGHLVLATIHSSNNASALLRLMDLGVTPMLMASGLDMLISQRLLRQLCDNCKRPAKLTQEQVYDFRKRKINYSGILEAKGCSKCDNTGYYGRTAICDILMLTNELKDLISNNTAFVTQLRKEGEKRGKSNLEKQGLKRIVSGETTLDELKRVIG